MSGTRATRAVRARAEHAEALVQKSTGARYPIQGHADGAYAFIGTRCDNVGLWVVYDSNSGRRAPDYWDGTSWQILDDRTDHKAAYRWSRKEAHELAEHYAKQASQIHKAYADMTPPEFARWLAGEAGAVLTAVQAADTEAAVA